jgi:hypothetical protein
VLPRRARFALPYPDEVPLLASVLTGRELLSRASPRLVEAAAYHNVAGYLLDAAREGSVVLGARELRPLGEGHLQRAARTALLRRELEDVVPLVAGACRAPPVLVKGAAVADRFYPDRRLRPYADLDLLLPRDRLSRAVAAVADRGYAVVEELRPGYAERFGHDVHVSRRAGAVEVDVELHWRIGDDRLGSPLDHAHVVAAAEPLRVGATTVLVPSVPDQLLLLAVHLLSDRARRLAWVNDVRLVAESATAEEWDEAFSTAEAIGGGLLWVLHRALDQARHHLGLDRPRPRPPGRPPPFGPLRAVEELDLQAAPHIGRLVALRGAERLAYLRAVALPSRAGLEGTVGGDGAAMPRLVARHVGRTLRGLMRPKRP